PPQSPTPPPPPPPSRKQPHDRTFHVHIKSHIDATILQRSNHLQPSAVSHVAQSPKRVSAERALQNSSILRAVKQRAPLLQLLHPLRRFLRVQLRHAPVVQHLSAAHRVPKMWFPAVRRIHIRHRRRDSPLRHHRVRLAQQRFAHHAHRSALPQRFNRRAQSCSPGANHQHIVFVRLESFAQKILTS